MTKTSIRAKALACALLAGTAYCGLTAAPARAQSATTPPRQVIDENGVDVASGQFRTAAESVDIAGLGFGVGWTGTLGHDSFDIFVVPGATSTEKRVFIAGATRVYVSSGGSSYAPQDADGSVLTQTSSGYTLRLASGTEYTFKLEPSQGSFAISKWVVDTITDPDKRTLTVNYRTATYQQCGIQGGGGSGGVPCTTISRIRIQSVTDNLGHMLKFAYASDSVYNSVEGVEDQDFQRLVSVTAIDLSVDYCSPTADTCGTLPHSWPKLGIGQSAGTGGTSVETITDSGNNQTNVTSDPAKGVVGVDLPANPGNDTAVSYDANGRVSTLTRNGVTWTYTYVDNSSAGTLTTTAVRTGAGNVAGGSRTTVVDKASNRPLSETDELGHTTSYQYDASGRLERVTFPEGNYVATEYDARGNVTKTRRVGKGGAGPEIVTSAAFPDPCANPVTCNRPASTTDERGNTTNYSYDGIHGGITQVLLPAPTPSAPRPQIDYTYTALYGRKKNASGQLVAETVPVYKPTRITTCASAATCAGSADETVVTITYDANNVLPETVTTAAGNGSVSATVTTVYDEFDRVKTVTGPVPGAATRYYYDAAGRVRGLIGPDPDGAGLPLKNRALRYSYDAEDRVTKVERGTATSQDDGAIETIAVLETVDSGYDASGRRTRDSLTAGGIVQALTQTSYDALGRVDCVAQRMNKDAFATVTSDACVLGNAGTDPDKTGPDRIVKTGYNLADQVTQVTSGFATAAAATVGTGYTVNGLVETVTDGENNKTTYAYDSQDRLSRTYFPVSGSNPIVKGQGASAPGDYEEVVYETHDLGARSSSFAASFRNRAGEITGFTFDALGRLTFKDLPGSEPDVSYGYDLLGRMTSASRTGLALGFKWDALGRNVEQTGPRGTVASAWDAGGRRTLLTDAGGLAIAYDYLATGETAKIRENASAFVLATFAYDDLGRRTSLTRGNGTVTGYAYDPALLLSQLTQNLTGTANDLQLDFTNDPAGAIVRTVRTGDVYAWKSHFNASRTEEPNGLNQLARLGGVTPVYDAKGNMTSDGRRSFTYSSENRLLTASGGVTLGYDPLGRLATIASGNAPAIELGYDGLDVIAEYNPAGTLLRRYVHGPGADEPLVWYEGTGTTGSARRYLHADERGSIVAVSNSAGNPIGVNRYDEYGAPWGGNIGRFQYTGQVWLGEAGLYYYKARMYDPDSGRFLQADPIGFGGGQNWYAYVGGDPVNFRDPLGLDEEKDCVADQCGDIIIVGTRLGRTGSAGRGRSIRNPIDASSSIGARLTDDEQLQPNPCAAAPSNVSLRGTLVLVPFGPAYFSGTLKDVATGRTYSISGTGYGGGFVAGTFDVRGTVAGFDALSNGLDVAFAIGPHGSKVARITDNNGRSVGEGSVSAAITLPIPAHAGVASIDPPQLALTSPGRC